MSETIPNNWIIVTGPVYLWQSKPINQSEIIEISDDEPDVIEISSDEDENWGEAPEEDVNPLDMTGHWNMQDDAWDEWDSEVEYSNNNRFRRVRRRM